MSESAYPLCWPAGWPRTTDRKYGRFATKESSGQWPRHKDITIAQAVRRINDELQTFDGPGRNWSRINPSETVISTNLSVRKSDGGIASDQRRPDDPGVAVYFVLDGKRQCVPCDSYTEVAQNLAAVAATLAALRTLERHGSGLMERAFTGFAALPDQSGEAWWAVLGLAPDASGSAVRAAYLIKRSETHPDKGGSTEEFTRLAEAWKSYLRTQE